MKMKTITCVLDILMTLTSFKKLDMSLSKMSLRSSQLLEMIQLLQF